MENSITVETLVLADIDTAWVFWTEPKHIINWNFASADWECPLAEHDLKVGGTLKYHMAAKDGSVAFDFEGTFSKVEQPQLLEYTIKDGRRVSIQFIPERTATKIIETFQIEESYPIEMQKDGWQAILNSFKRYVENNN